jgi:hypothetical protein
MATKAKPQKKADKSTKGLLKNRGNQINDILYKSTGQKKKGK